MTKTVVYVSCAEPREIVRLEMDPNNGALQRLGDARFDLVSRQC